MTALDLSKLAIVDGVEHVEARDGSLQLKLLPASGAYGAISPPIRDWWQACELPAVVQADIEAEVAPVGIALFAPDLGSLMTGERRVRPEDGRVTVSLYVDKQMPDGRFMVRTYGATNECPRVRLHAVRCESAERLSPTDVKRIRASEFTFWYYSMDLGDGVVTQAGLPDAPIRMAGHFKSRAILQWLLDRFFGGVKGKTVLEPACSGGFHALETARRGARVIAHDVDRVGLAQARLATDCVRDQLAIVPEYHHASIYDFKPAEPADIVYCSGLLYHLPDIPLAAKIIFANCTEGAVIQSSISTLDGDVLEFAGTSNYGFAVPRGEFAFIPTRSVLPKIFAWAGFTEQHWFDLTEFLGTPDDPDIGYRPGVAAGSAGPVYGVLRKSVQPPAEVP